MSSISAMGPHFFHWKNKLWVRGGRSRLALSENIEIYFGGAVYDRFMPSKPANLRDPYKIRFSVFFEKSKNGVNPMVWRCREFFFSKTFCVFSFFRPDVFPIFICWGHFCILRKRMLCPENRFRFIPVPVHAGSGSNRFPVNRTRFPIPGLIPKFPEDTVTIQA